MPRPAGGVAAIGQGPCSHRLPRETWWKVGHEVSAGSAGRSRALTHGHPRMYHMVCPIHGTATTRGEGFIDKTGLDGAVGRCPKNIAVAQVELAGGVGMDLDPGMPGDLGDRIAILQQPGLVGPPAVVEQRMGIGGKGEITVPLERGFGIRHPGSTWRKRNPGCGGHIEKDAAPLQCPMPERGKVLLAPLGSKRPQRAGGVSLERSGKRASAPPAPGQCGGEITVALVLNTGSIHAASGIKKTPALGRRSSIAPRG